MAWNITLEMVVRTDPNSEENLQAEGERSTTGEALAVLAAGRGDVFDAIRAVVATWPGCHLVGIHTDEPARYIDEVQLET